ncbi:MAG: leucyl/phenylalanyl-tRNA--protein transferase [Paracoccaceae bacterium]
MAESRNDPELHWIDPSQRGILPINGFHISRSLRKTILSNRFTARFNTDFAQVVHQCADREETWINQTIFELYLELHKTGHAHAQEIWLDDKLVGGVYGITLGSAFFGESMFSTETDASKTSLAFLVDRLRTCGFTLFDTQFLTSHLASLGAIEISRNDYLNKLGPALSIDANLGKLTVPQTAQDVIQRSAQTS